MNPGSVAVVVVEDIGVPSWDLYELSIPCTVFGKPQPDLADTWYDLRLCSTGEPQQDGSSHGTGLSLRTPYGLDDLVGADTVIVPSVPDPCVDEGQPLPPALITALRQAYDAGARMVSLCTGAFALAEAGLLDGRRATAHWMHTAQLAERYPKVQVDDSVLYVDDGDVLTSAGLTAGLDLCLHLGATWAHTSPTSWPAGWWCPPTGPAARRSSSTCPCPPPTTGAWHPSWNGRVPTWTNP